MKVEILDIVIENKTALTDSVIEEGSIFSTPQLEYIKRLMVDAAQEMLNLQVDPNNIQGFVQQHASLEGQMQMLQCLVNNSVESEARARVKAANNQEQ